MTSVKVIIELAEHTIDIEGESSETVLGSNGRHEAIQVLGRTLVAVAGALQVDVSTLTKAMISADLHAAVDAKRESNFVANVKG